jgi:glycopeptide antibiotics resistance protein
LSLAKGRCNLKTQAAKLLFVPYLICLCAIVFTPVDPNSAGIFGFIQITGLIERFLNLFLLMPLAILTKISYKQLSFRTILIICIATSAGIELIQLTIPGRISDPIDVLTNSLGALLALTGIWKLTMKPTTHEDCVTLTLPTHNSKGPS